ncbi:HEAT repeat domain-containing protein [Humisphaera borealis]|uniref:HEAT repeat domain-containing protein n=1 Tax=Humisphaera borealis TaxID=2807512 RepID=A0A7M2WSB1_9BACT|nr:HEAT repeat domain-containing protein [Humisphaera borealis]QOV87480.1 HEAT repeat domain-containing protein [Humisphaera borealis]
MKKKSTPKRHTAAPRSATIEAPATKPSVTSQTVTAGKPESVVVAKATPEVSSKATKTEVSPTTDSNPAVSAVTMTAPADAVEKMPAEQSADSVMANTTPTAALVNSLRDTSADVASEAAAALGATGDHSAVKPLSDVIANADGYYHPVVRAAAATSLGKLGDTKAVPALIAGIRDEMAEASAESIRALAAIGDARAVAPLVEVVRNAEGFYLSFVRRAAVMALVKLGGPEATTMLRVVADNFDEDPVIRQVAVDALA